MTTLRAGDGLALRHTAENDWRVAWGQRDWLGPLTARCGAGAAASGSAGDGAVDQREANDRDFFGPYSGVEWNGQREGVRFSVRAYPESPLIIFRIECRDSALAGLATGSFADPSVVWPHFVPKHRDPADMPAGLSSYGYQYCEFALPVFGDADARGFVLHPERPRVIQPLAFIAEDGRTLLFAALDGFHEQIIAIDDGDAPQVSIGWHGDLESVPARFSTELALVAAASPRAAFEVWGSLLRLRFGKQPVSRYADAGIGQLSYWTDNGASYYYRTAEQATYEETLSSVVDTLRAADVPVASVQLDSWFYPHEQLRPVSAAGASVVPPTGMIAWEPRSDLFPNGFANLRQSVRGLPLTFHSRHISAKSPYGDRFDCWTDADYLHPLESAFFSRLLDQARTWGAITYEQDWLVESFLGVRGLRAQPGRAAAWQRALDDAARERGLTLQWCMATPADFLQTVTLSQVTSIRTSGDYRYLFDNGLNWVWFLHTNVLARALGLIPYKDVLLTHGPTETSPGEPYAEIELLLASLSAGPVGIGDEIGRTNRELVLRSCREDGVLVKPDVPIAAVDRCFGRNAYTTQSPLIAASHTQHPAGTWSYVVALNPSSGKQAQTFEVRLGDLGAQRPAQAVWVFDWRRRSVENVDPDGGWRCELAFQDWDYRVVCPQLADGDVAFFGDVSRYATVGDQRVANLEWQENTLRFAVLDRPGSVVRVEGFARRRPGEVRCRRCLRSPTSVCAGDDFGWSAADGRWWLATAVGGDGWTNVEIEFP